VKDDATKVRRDVRRNRERILAAGRELFRDSSDVPMYEVAKRAGVGQATVYRHFPDKWALIDAISQVEFAGLVELAAARAGDPDGMFALLGDLSRRLADLRGLIELIRSDPADLAQGRREEIGALFAGPLASAKAAGSVRPDLEIDDVFRIIMMIEGVVSDEPDRAARRRSTERALALVFDGLRP
jgi:AcrR family transcriptional regulator